MSTHATSSEEETRQVAARLAGALAPGTVILLHGDLGAGKTAFVRGLAEGLGVAEDEVSSPTFTLVHEYRGGRLPLYHADLYRLPAGTTLDELERTGGRYGLVTLCIGAGMGVATIIERV